ncbi:MAG: primosomal protein [Rhodobacteraceae bacterium]|nr:primosomal protein [Paracoccaceae bacterium]
MSKINLLTSWAPFEYSSEMVKESKELNDGKIIMKGILQKSDTLNQNGRIYPKAILEREIRNYQKFIKERRSLGECDHPESSVVELKNASHIILEAHMDGDVVYGTVELLSTPSGKILQSLVESGITLGISSRGVGSTVSQGANQVVQDDFQLICWDFVSEPSTPGAFMMREGVQIDTKDLNKVFNASDRAYRICNDIINWDK